MRPGAALLSFQSTMYASICSLNGSSCLMYSEMSLREPDSVTEAAAFFAAGYNRSGGRTIEAACSSTAAESISVMA